jgi:Pyruvate/2-oxoacid:ferredoxin oxidoreductase delta subunit
MKVPCKPEKIIFDYEHCDSCGLCIDVCPEKAISWFTVKK